MKKWPWCRYCRGNCNMPFILYSFFSIPNVQFIPQLINVIATNNDLLTDELNAIYFAPKLWLYVMIWLPRTTDNSTYFAQSLEIRGIESRLYILASNLTLNKWPIQISCLHMFILTNGSGRHSWGNRSFLREFSTWLPWQSGHSHNAW